jgi:cell wall-associated NlpC family hydrolase
MKRLIDYAMQFVGTPYKWGGNNHDGIDCSGLVEEILRSVGVEPEPRGTAQTLYDYFKDGLAYRGPGAICFFGKDKDHITHTAFMIDEVRMIEAGGGGPTCLTREDADQMNAFVRIRPYILRRDFVAAFSPNYPGWMEKI